MKKVGTIDHYEIIKRGRVHVTYELHSGGKRDATYKTLEELYAHIEWRKKRLQEILAACPD